MGPFREPSLGVGCMISISKCLYEQGDCTDLASCIGSLSSALGIHILWVRLLVDISRFVFVLYLKFWGHDLRALIGQLDGVT